MRTCLLIALACPALAGDVLTVGGHPAADFAVIQDAVDAAADGDVVLVWTGVYDPFVVNGKGVTVTARPGNEVRIEGGVTVLATAPHQEVTLIALEVEADHFVGFGQEEALLAVDALGGLRVERCELHGADGWAYSGQDHGGDAVRLSGCPDVAIVHSLLHAGDGAESFGGLELNRGGDGLEAADSNVALLACTVLGGHGGDHDLIGDGIEGYAGRGVVLVGATLGVLHDADVTGGNAGATGLLCPPGGHAVLVGAGAHAQLLGGVRVGGQSGCHPGGTPGDPLHVEAGGTSTTLNGLARAHDAPTPVVAQTPFTLELHGAPGDAAYLLLSHTKDFTLNPGAHGALLVGVPLAMKRRFLGLVPASGTLTTVLAAPAVPPGQESYHFDTQALFVDAGGAAWLATPSTLVVLE